MSAPTMTPEQASAPIANPSATADLAAGFILATVEVDADPERVFQALASPEVTDWWVRPGVFDTRAWETSFTRLAELLAAKTAAS